jgi:hypothetical protein
VGDLTRTDVAQSEARLALSKAQLQQAEARLIASKENYIQLVGSEPDNLASPPTLPNLPATPDAAVEVALDEFEAAVTAVGEADADDLEATEARARDLEAEVERLQNIVKRLEDIAEARAAQLPAAAPELRALLAEHALPRLAEVERKAYLALVAGALGGGVWAVLHGTPLRDATIPFGPFLVAAALALALPVAFLHSPNGNADPHHPARSRAAVQPARIGVGGIGWHAAMGRPGAARGARHGCGAGARCRDPAT